MNEPLEGTVYTETVVWSPPEAWAADAPYQIAIVELPDRRLTVRIAGERVSVGDRVRFVEYRRDVPFFERLASMAA